MEPLERLFVVIHNVYSVARLGEAARITYALGVKNFVITKAVGAAAQEGVPDVQKLALRMGRNMIFLADLKDAIDAISPDAVFVFAPPQHAKRELDPAEVARLLASGKKVMFVFGGAEPGLTRKELELGEPVRIKGIGDLGPIGLLTVALYEVVRALENIKGEGRG